MSKKLLLFLLSALLLTLGQGCTKAEQARIDAEATKPITLNYWRVFDEQDAFTEILAAYRARHPNVTINYRKLSLDEFDKEVVTALAEDRGPDIISLPNTWLAAWQSRLLPLPKAVTISFPRTEKTTFGEKLVVETKQLASITPAQIKSQFVGVVESDVVRLVQDPVTQGVAPQIYGLPLALDTLALFYNKDLLDRNNIPEPPKTWEEFQDQVKKLTKVDQDNNILQVGAALGGSTNVARGADLLALLMMQNGTVMTEGSRVTFNLRPEGFTEETPPGLRALEFYTDFAQPTKVVYTWNNKLPDSLDAFTRGLAAFFFGYSYNIPLIKARAPRLNFSVVSVPQLSPLRPVNFTSYLVESVLRKTKYPDQAWDFIQFATSAQNVSGYLTRTKRPTALRALVASQITDPDVAPFASAVLTAKSWYKGRDAVAAEKSFLGMVDEVLGSPKPTDFETYLKAINNAAGKVGLTY